MGQPAPEHQHGPEWIAILTWCNKQHGGKQRGGGGAGAAEAAWGAAAGAGQELDLCEREIEREGE
jgi:hypothetical protein